MICRGRRVYMLRRAAGSYQNAFYKVLGKFSKVVLLRTLSVVLRRHSFSSIV